VTDQLSNPYGIAGTITALYVSTSAFLDSNRNTQSPGTNDNGHSPYFALPSLFMLTIVICWGTFQTFVLYHIQKNLLAICMWCHEYTIIIIIIIVIIISFPMFNILWKPFVIMTTLIIIYTTFIGWWRGDIYYSTSICLQWVIIIIIIIIITTATILYSLQKSVHEIVHVTNWAFNEVPKRLQRVVLLVTCRMTS
jgi:ABC-type multidrug transport system fused ATPase/permease subunit